MPGSIVKETKVYECRCGFDTTDAVEFSKHFITVGRAEPGKHKSMKPPKRQYNKKPTSRSTDSQTKVHIVPREFDQSRSTPPSNNDGNGHQQDQLPPPPPPAEEPEIRFTHKLSLAVVADMYYQAALKRGYQGTMDDFVMECIVNYHEESLGLTLGLVNLAGGAKQ